MKKETYDLMVESLLKAVNMDASDVIKVTVEPHQTTVRVLVHQDNLMDVMNIKTSKGGTVVGEFVIEREDAFSELPNVTQDASDVAISRMDPVAQNLIREYRAARDAK